MIGDEIKQVIVVRKDLNMPKGKIASQVAHASMGVLLKLGRYEKVHDEDGNLLSHEFKLSLANWNNRPEYNHPQVAAWLEGQFTKVCVYVNSEAEMMELQQRAIASGLPNYLIIDSGKTMFNSVPTVTCLAIGPAFASEIDPITGTLKLL